jgi:hypothetical protein
MIEFELAIRTMFGLIVLDVYIRIVVGSLRKEKLTKGVKISLRF